MKDYTKEDLPSIPWDIIKLKHINEYGYSGTLIRALRVKNNLTRNHLAGLLKMRRSKLQRIEETDRIGIKLAKQLASIFKVEDWRVLRECPKSVLIGKK